MSHEGIWSEYRPTYSDGWSAVKRKGDLVRCRDCKGFDAKVDGCWWFSHFEQMGDYSWAGMPVDVEPDGFCAWGVRRESE